MLLRLYLAYVILMCKGCQEKQDFNFFQVNFPKFRSLSFRLSFWEILSSFLFKVLLIISFDLIHLKTFKGMFVQWENIKYCFLLILCTLKCGLNSLGLGFYQLTLIFCTAQNLVMFTENGGVITVYPTGLRSYGHL